jgi:hypothetical protein
MSQNLRMSTTPPSSEAAWYKRLLYSLTDRGLFSAGVVNLAVGSWSALKGEVAIAATSLTAGLVLLFAATIDRFESLKGWGIEAKTRQLDQKIAQADEALRKLKEVTELMAPAIISQHSGMGRFGTAPGHREIYTLAQNLRDMMASLGSETSSIRQALEPWVHIFCFDLATALLLPLHTALAEKKKEFERNLAVMHPSDANLARTTAAIQEINTYIEQRLRDIYPFRVDDYPDRFLQLFEDAPLLSEEVLVPIQAKARQFAPAMLELRQNLQLVNPESWFVEIDEYRKRP